MMIKFITAIILFWLSTFCQALQYVDVSDQKAHLIKISTKEMTRISVAQGKIRRLDYIEGDLELIRDDEAGAYLIMARVKKPINVFVTTSHGFTHALILQPADIPLEHVILQEPVATTTKLTKLEQTGILESIIKQLTLSMARAKPLSDFTVTLVNKLVYLSPEAQWVLLNTYQGLVVTGEHYLLHNLSTQPVHLEETQFFQAGVLSIAFDNPKLHPGESTNVYIIKNNYEH